MPCILYIKQGHLEAWHGAQSDAPSPVGWNKREIAPTVIGKLGAMQEQTPGPQDAAKRRQILEKMGGIVGLGLDGHTELRVEPYGSFLSGLYSPTGDLDISIEGFCGKECVPQDPCFMLQRCHPVWCEEGHHQPCIEALNIHTPVYIKPSHLTWGSPCDIFRCFCTENRFPVCVLS